jgi:hypothetical protein
VDRPPCDLEECLDDPGLEPQHRHLLAVALRWQRFHIARLEAQHAATDDKLEQLQRSLDDHLKEAAPAMDLIKRHERTLDQANTIFRLAFCRTWQFAAAVLAVWLVIVEIAEHMKWAR